MCIIEKVISYSNSKMCESLVQLKIVLKCSYILCRSPFTKIAKGGIIQHHLFLKRNGPPLSLNKIKCIDTLTFRIRDCGAPLFNTPFVLSGLKRLSRTTGSIDLRSALSRKLRIMWKNYIARIANCANPAALYSFFWMWRHAALWFAVVSPLS